MKKAKKEIKILDEITLLDFIRTFSLYEDVKTLAEVSTKDIITAGLDFSNTYEILN